MRIDLHLHSPFSEPNGDAIKWVDTRTSLIKLVQHNVKIAAFSDHNVFNTKFYKEVRDLSKSANLVILPAIEANVTRNDGKIANLLYIFPETLKDEQLQQIETITKLYIPKKGITIKKANDIFKDFKTIKIPHIGKSDHFKYKDILELKYDAFEVSNLKHPNYVSIMKKGIKTSTVSFSDTHIWKKYPQIKKLITDIELKEATFICLKNALLKNKVYSKEWIDI